MKLNIQEGDIVDIVAPASACSKEELDRAVVAAEKLGLVPRYDIDFLKPSKYLSNSDEFRARDFHRAFMAPDSKLVWALRGGYGSIRILNTLAKAKKPDQKKLFVGLSDISNLHWFIEKQWRAYCLHAPVFTRLGERSVKPKEIRELKKAIFEFDSWSLAHPKLKALNSEAKKLKEVSGKLCGGNLCSLVSLSGSAYSFDAKNKIVFLEEVSERAYKIDRMLYQLRLSSNLNSARAILFGDFIGGDEPDGKNLVKLALKQFALETKVPVFSGVKSGHGLLQLPILLNQKSSIKLLDKGGFTLLNGRVL